MPQVINTNVASLNAQRNLNRSQGLLQTSLQRISSGLRVNSAKDDAAGLAIANRLTTQFRGFNQAARNAADAISLAQTGEGALQEITNNLQRMRELAVQARNVTNTDADRASLDQEFQQLLAENDRISQVTSFNGKKLLDGSLGSSVFQVGANVGETISVDISTSMRNSAIGNVASTTLTVQNGTQTTNAVNIAGLTLDGISFAADDLKINSVAIGAATNGSNGQGDGSAKSIAEAINKLKDSTGVTAEAQAATKTITAADIGNALTFTEAVGGTDDTLQLELQLNGEVVTTQSEGDSMTAADLAGAFNAVSNKTGVTARVSTNGDVVLTAADGRNIELAEVLKGATDATDKVKGFLGNDLIGIEGTTDTAAKGEIVKGSIKLTASRTITIEDSDSSSGTTDVDIFAGITNGTSSTINANAIQASDLLSVSNVDDAILRIDQALSDVDSLRGVFGAVQNRFESTIASLQTAAENAAAARSRIVDADFAEETAKLTRAQILQQAGVSILSQANALPQNVLALLQ